MTFQNNNVFANELDDNRTKISKNRLKFGPVEIYRVSEVPDDSEGRIGDIAIIDDTAGPSTVPISERVPTTVGIYHKETTGWKSFVTGSFDVSGLLPTSEFTRWTTNQVVITEKADFPDPVGGVIQLEDNTHYLIADHIDLGTDRLVLGVDTPLRGLTDELSSISSNLADDALITSTNLTSLQSLNLQAGSNGHILNCDGSGSVVLSDCYIQNSASVGTLNDCNSFFIESSALFATDGVTIQGNVTSFVIDTSLFQTSGSGSSAFNITAGVVAASRLRFSSCSFITAADTTAITVDPSITINDEALFITDCIFRGPGTYISGVEPADDMAFFKDNINLQGSRSYSLITMTGNSTETVINTVDTFVKVAGNTIAGVQERFAMPVGGRMTYTGTKPRVFKVTADVSITGGNNVETGLTFGVNGTPNTTYTTRLFLDAAGRSYANTVSTIIELDTNDYIELFIRNETGTTNFTVTDLSFMAHEI